MTASVNGPLGNRIVHGTVRLQPLAVRQNSIGTCKPTGKAGMAETPHYRMVEGLCERLSRFRILRALERLFPPDGRGQHSPQNFFGNSRAAVDLSGRADAQHTCSYDGGHNLMVQSHCYRLGMPTRASLLILLYSMIFQYESFRMTFPSSWNV